MGFTKCSFKKSKCNILLPKKNWDEVSLIQVVLTAVFSFSLARNQNDLFLPCSALCHAVVTVRFVSTFEAHPQELSHLRELGNQSPGHLLHQSSTFRQVCLLEAWMVLPCAVAAKLPGSYDSSLLLGEQKRKKNLDAERPCTCLLASRLTPEHPLGPPQGWAGLSHSDRCFSPLRPASFCGSHPLPGLLGTDGPVALCTPSTSAEPGHVRGPSQGPACTPGAPAPMPPPGGQPGAPSRIAS